MRVIRLGLVVLAVVWGIASADTKPPQTFDIWLRAAAEVDETGHVRDLQWETQTKSHALVAERVAPIVRSWEFVPATANGRPAPTRTGLLIRLSGEQQTDGSVSVRLISARTGPFALSRAPPVYPKLAILDDIEARVVVTAEVSADGSPVIREVTYKSHGKGISKQYREAFIDSANEAVMHWTFQPELVADHVVTGSSVRIPIEYCLGSKRSKVCEQDKPVADAERKLPDGMYLGDASALALKTEIREQSI